MARQYQIPGGRYVNEETNREHQIAGDRYVNDSTAAAVAAVVRMWLMFGMGR